MNSKGTLADLEAAHERVRAETGEADGDELAALQRKRDELQSTCELLYNRIDVKERDLRLVEEASRVWLRNGCEWRDKYEAAEAELAALRRVEAENLPADRSANEDVPAWRVGSIGHKRGYGPTLAEALADYDAKKEQR